MRGSRVFSNPVTYNLLIYCNNHLKQLYISNKMEHFGHKGGCGYVNIIRVLRPLKEELAWATNKQLKVVSNKMFFKTIIPLKN